MYFIPRNNRLYARFAHVRPSYRYGITCSSIFVCVAMWWYLVYQPLTGVIISCNNTACTLQQQDITYQQTQQSNISAEQLHDLRQEIDAYKLDTLSLRQQCAHILTSADNYGLTLRSYTTNTTKNKGWYIQDTMQFSFIGGLDQFSYFLTYLCKSRQLTSCTHVQYVRTDHNNFLITCDIKTLHIV